MGINSISIKGLTRSITKVLLVLFVASFATTGFSQDGEKLFKANCSSCHKITGRLTGPELAGVQDRWEDEAALISWIQNSQAYLENNPGDSYAADLFNKFNGTIMPAQPVSEDEVKAILEYIANPPEDVKPVEAVAESAPVADEPMSPMWIASIAVLLILVIGVLVRVRKSLHQLLVETKSIEASPYQEPGLWQSLVLWLKRNKAVTAVLTVMVLIYALTQVWYALLNIGVYQGYAPEQPIKFSHKIHAGDNAINCVYCHHGAEQGRVAGIPSVNVCMNCHKGISEGKKWGSEEIAKIYDAAGWNPETAEYDKPGKPIEWVRIHNLPDFAYFNHSQHVVVGGQKCQTCHGPVEEIEYPMVQHSDLTMGWCINCHRETNINIENGYYQAMHKDLKEMFKDEKIEGFKVEHIGGLECAKCHY